MDFICRQQNFFKNPNKLPLNELQLEVKTIKRKKKLPNDKNIEDIKDTLSKNYDVRIEKRAALHPDWIQKEHSYYKYQPYYSEVAKEENELFLSKNKLFRENLKFLLQCTYHQFWNYIAFEPRVKAILRSFLFNPVQMYELKHLEGEYLRIYNDIYVKVATVYLRIVSFEESNVEFMSDDTVMKLIETNKIINYGDIVNIFMLYSKTNPKLISKIHQLFFTPKLDMKYTKELVTICNHFLLVFDMVGGQICGFEDNSIMIPIGIRPRPSTFDPYWLEEIVTYLLDTATTLNSLLSNCTPSVESAFSLGLPYRLTYFYNRIYPALYEMMHDRSDLPHNWLDIQTRILDHIALGRNEFVNAFHTFVTHFMDDIIQTLGDNEKQDAFLERYLSLLSAALEDEYFIFDYHNAHHIDIQLQTLADFHPQMDHMRTNYILECLSTLPTLEKLKEMKVQSKSELDFTMPSVPSTIQENGHNSEATEKEAYTETKILDLTKSIEDTLPHLGDGFIRECLKSYNYNTAEVISAILDENLLPHLNNLPRDLIYVPPEPQPQQPTLAYKGKKPDYKDAAQLLNDKSQVKEMKDFILKSSNVLFDIYDDEYDDRYDDEPVLRFYDKTDESSMYEHIGKRFEGYELVSDPSESSSDEQEEEAGASKSKDAFCEDPAILRAKREANRNNRGRNHDVVGKPKGQGQEKAVLHNREKKNVNKSSRANHNRKSGAQWKRNKGMIPF